MSHKHNEVRVNGERQCGKCGVSLEKKSKLKRTTNQTRIRVLDSTVSQLAHYVTMCPRNTIMREIAAPALKELRELLRDEWRGWED